MQRYINFQSCILVSASFSDGVVLSLVVFVLQQDTFVYASSRYGRHRRYVLDRRYFRHCRCGRHRIIVHRRCLIALEFEKSMASTMLWSGINGHSPVILIGANNGQMQIG
jgi:hypothetical protein